MATFAPFPDFTKKTTITAVKSGNANDPSVWDQNRPLQDGDWLFVPSGIAITWDLTSSPRLGGFVIDGTLDAGSVAGAKDLKLATGLVRMGGKFIAGDCINNIPLKDTLTVTFLDVAPDSTFDPGHFGTGFLTTGGMVDLCGSADKTAWVWTPSAKAGDTTLSLLSSPNDWNPGDELLLPGTMLSPVQDEVVKIQSVSGASVTLAAPLQYDHLPLPGPQGQVNNLPVGNLSRNIVFKSENPLGTRGHCMFMKDMMSGTPSIINACHIRVIGCGRTDASRPVTDPMVDANGVLVPGTTDNVRARYAWHSHRQGQGAGSLQTWEGIVVQDYKKWGFDNHDSNVNATNLLAYSGQGAGCATERGTELGTYTNCLSVRATGDGSSSSLVNLIDSRLNVDDWGWFGNGFWFQGPGVAVSGCVAAGCQRGGFFFYLPGNSTIGVTATTYPAANLWMTSLPGWSAGTDVPMRFVPLKGCSNNIAFGCGEAGHTTWGTRPLVRSVLDTLTTWNTPYGIGLSYTFHLDVNNPVLTGPNYATGSVGINENNGYTRDIRVNDASIGGYEQGYVVPLIDQNLIGGGFWANVQDFSFWNFQDGFGGGVLMPPASVKFTSAPTFGPVTDALLAGRPRQNYYLWPFASKPNLPTNLWGYFVPYTITLADGRQLYFPEQGNGVIPFPSSKTWPDWLPAAMKDQTNAQLWTKFGLATNGVAAPADATPLAGSNGLVGTAVPARAYYAMASAATATAGQPYFLSYYDVSGTSPTVKETTASPLVPGVNILTRTINDQTYSFLPYLPGTAPPPPPTTVTTTVAASAVQLRRVALTASVTSSSGAVVNEGSVAFIVQQNGLTVATATASITAGKATATVEIPVGAYTAQASYSDAGGTLPASSGSVSVTAN